MLTTGSSVSIVSGYRLDDQGSIRGRDKRINGFSSNLCVQTGSGAHPTSSTMGTRVLSLGCNMRLGRDTDHPPPSSSMVKNELELYSSPSSHQHGVAGQLHFYFANLTCSYPNISFHKMETKHCNRKCLLIPGLLYLYSVKGNIHTTC
jgi:hypothetical protein